MSAVAFDTPRQATRVDDIGGRFDPWLLGVSIALACFGVVMVGSAAVAGAGMDVGPWYFLNRHALFLAGGVHQPQAVIHSGVAASSWRSITWRSNSGRRKLRRSRPGSAVGGCSKP